MNICILESVSMPLNGIYPNMPVFLPHIFMPGDQGIEGQRYNMRAAKMFRYRVLSALIAAVMVSCLPVLAVLWQYEGNSSSEPQQSQTSLSPNAIAANAQSNAESNNSSSANDGGIWNWGGTPRGFSTSNGTLKYPADYYSSRFNLGYNNSVSPYGKNNLQNLSHYSTGFTTGYLPGYDISSLLSDEKSSYDPWNNYPGYDPNYPYGYPSS
jgi:hypothetical protein